MRLLRTTLCNLARMRGETTLDLDALRGDVVAVTGPNGVGKSTGLGSAYAGAMFRAVPEASGMTSLRDLMNDDNAYLESVIDYGRGPVTIRHTLSRSKQESHVRLADGTLPIHDAKVSTFDRWAAENLPGKDVFFASVFSAQGSGGILEGTTGERKAIILRFLGLERYEALAQAARAQADKVRRSSESKLAERRAVDEMRAAMETTERALADARAALEREEERTAKARGDLDQVKQRHAELIDAWTNAELARRRRREAAAQLDQVRRKIEVAQGRLDRARELIEDAPNIREAVERQKRLQVEREAVNSRMQSAAADLATAQNRLQRIQDMRREREAAATAADIRARRVRDRVAAEDVEGRLARAREVLTRADEIRAAVTEDEQQSEAHRALDVQVAEAHAAVSAVDAEFRSLDEMRVNSDAARRQAGERVSQLERRVIDIEGLRARAATLTERQEDVETAVEALAKTEQELESARGAGLDVAGRRITGLRGALVPIALEVVDDAKGRAADALRADDELLSEAQGAPERITLGEEGVRTCREVLDRARAALADAQRASDALPAAEQAAQDLAAAREAYEAARVAVVDLVRRADAMAKERSAAEARVAELVTSQRHIAQRRTELAPLASRERELATAGAVEENLGAQLRQARADEREALDEAKRVRDELVATQPEMDGAGREVIHHRDRLQDIEAMLRETDAGLREVFAAASRLSQLEQHEAVVSEIEQRMRELDEELVAASERLDGCPEPLDAEPVPDVSVEEQRVEAAQWDLDKARQRAAVAERDHQVATEGAGRLRGIEAEIAAIHQELADWTRLADDFGRNGLQALIIDAAGPELTATVNDLLQAAYGARYVVEIETTRPKKSGDGDIEVFDVTVEDTESGYRGPATRLSGGQRVIVGTALRFALLALACRRAGWERPTLVIDEGGAALDRFGAAGAWISMLRRASALIGVHKCVVVTHSEAVEAGCDAVVGVKDGAFVVRR